MRALLVTDVHIRSSIQVTPTLLRPVRRLELDTCSKIRILQSIDSRAASVCFWLPAIAEQGVMKFNIVQSFLLKMSYQSEAYEKVRFVS